jgi:hypothetical protein
LNVTHYGFLSRRKEERKVETGSIFHENKRQEVLGMASSPSHPTAVRVSGTVRVVGKVFIFPSDLLNFLVG